MTIKEARLLTGKTQGQVAKEIGITWRGYQKIESGKGDLRKSNSTTANGIAKALGVSMDDLMKMALETLKSAQETKVDGTEQRGML